MQTTYCNYFDLPLYCAIDSMLARNGRYRFDMVPKAPGVVWKSVLKRVEEADMQPLEVQRALALTFYGTIFSTEVLNKIVLAGVKEGDPFMAVALYKACEEELQFKILAAFDMDRLSLEETVFLLTIYQGNESFGKNLILSATAQLQRNPAFVLANPKTTGWLCKFILSSNCRTLFLEQLAFAVKRIAPENSAAYSALMDAGFSVLTSTMIIWCIRKYSGAFKLNKKRDEELEERLRSGLAHHYKEWSTEQKQTVLWLHGKLGERIDCVDNRKWYRSKFGLHLPEIGLPDGGYEEISTEYTEEERCELACLEQLSAEDAKRLGASFSVWKPEWHSYVRDAGCEASNVCYLLNGDEPINDLSNELLAAELQLRDTFSDEELPLALEASLNVSPACFVKVAHLCEELPDELMCVYNRFRYSYEGVQFDCEDYEIKYAKYPFIRKCRAAGIDVDRVIGWNFYDAESQLGKLEDLEGFINAFKDARKGNVPVSFNKLIELYQNGIIDLADYVYKESLVDKETKRILVIAESGEVILQHLSIFECIANVDRVSEVLANLYVLKEARGVYGHVVWQILREWVLSEHVMGKLTTMFIPYGVPADWLECWSSIANKRLEQLLSLEGFTPWTGWIEDMQAMLTPQGIIVAGDINTDELPMPVFRLNEQGSNLEFAILCPIGSLGVPDILGVPVYHHCFRSYKVSKLN